MTLFRPTHVDEDLSIITEHFNCTDKAHDEVMHYARVLAARGLPAEYILLAVTKYARVRGQVEEWGYE